MRKIIVFPKAKKDIANSMDWYKKQANEFLSNRFKVSIFESIDSLQNDEIEYAKVKLGFSRILVKKFPYTIYFIKNEKDICIFAVLHNKQSRLNLEGRI